MKHANVAIFVPHNGCPHQCTFCNQRSITGQTYQPNACDVEKTIKVALESLGGFSKNAEIAFFGGSFTAIDREYMLSLLNAAAPYLEYFKGVRISTRPDCIDQEIIDVLKQYKITAIELGVQSMSDKVLAANKRGHTAADVIKSALLIQKNAISLGLQMMTNLYMSNPDDDFYTAKKFIELKPDTVRIYPTAVLQGTELAQLYENKLYKPYSLEESVEQCAYLLKMFEDNNINVIRLGLHSGGGVDESLIAGTYHPAFRQLCESKIMLDSFAAYLCNKVTAPGKIEIFVAPRSVSIAVGHSRRNLKALEKMGYTATIKADNSLQKREFIIKQR